VETEFFASPLNHHLPRYHSMYADTDPAFGYLGSFFRRREKPPQGCFKAHSPFTEVFMLESLLRIHELLQEATGPMSFAVVVPAWQREESWLTLCASPFLPSTPDSEPAPVFIEAHDHCYLDGTLYKRNDLRARPAPFGSGVFFLQNDPGAAKWPVTREAVSDLKDAFAKVQPGEELRIRVEHEVRSQEIPLHVMGKRERNWSGLYLAHKT